MQLVPSFALYRGLYEFAQYAFKSGYGSGGGLSFSNLNDGYNGMSVAMGIMVRAGVPLMSCVQLLARLYVVPHGVCRAAVKTSEMTDAMF